MTTKRQIRPAAIEANLKVQIKEAEAANVVLATRLERFVQSMDRLAEAQRAAGFGTVAAMIREEIAKLAKEKDA